MIFKSQRLAVLMAAAFALTAGARANLVADWAMNDASGNIPDSSGNGLTATPSASGLTYGQPGVPAGTYGGITVTPDAATALGSSVGFSSGGAFSVVNSPLIGNLLSGGQGNFTVMAWVQTNNLPASTTYSIFATGPSGGWGFGLYNVDHVLFTDYGCNNGYFSAGTFSANTGWHHVALTVSGGIWTMYADGNALGWVGSPNYIASDAANFLIGNTLGTTAQQFNGTISNLRLYDTALTLAQIATEAVTAYLEVPVLTPGQVSALTPAQVATLTPKQIVSLSAAQVGGLTGTQFSAFTATQLAAFTPAQVAGLTSAQIAAIPGQVGALTPAQIAALPVTQIAALTPTQIGALSVAQVAGLTPAQFSTLNSGQIGALTPAQVAGLTSGQIGVLTTGQIQAIATASVPSLTTGQLQALDPAQAAALIASQSGALTSSQSAVLSAASASGTVASMQITLYDTVTNGLLATTSVDMTGVVSTSLADGAGRVRQSVDGLGKITTATYDPAGHLLSRLDPTGAGTYYGYDSLGRMTGKADAAISGKASYYSYDQAGRLVSATDPLNVITTYTYDVRDRKLSESTPVSGSQNRVIQYGYDARGSMTTLTDANGAVTTWGYDGYGRQVSKTYANGDNRTMAYDDLGRLVTLTDENGKATTLVYDFAGRLTSKSYAADGSQDTYAYDASSRMTSATKGRYNHTLTYAYDSAGRLATETHPDGEVVNLAYDNANRVADINLAGTPVNYGVAYAYDARGQMSSVSTGDYSSTCLYRDNGQLASTIEQQVINPQSDILRTDLTYDAGARLTQVANTAINGDQAGVVYTLGADDQRLTATEETGQQWNYGYDGLKQLVSARKTDTSANVVPPLSQTYGYDPMGNRSSYTEQGSSVAYTTNPANQYTSVVVTTGTYAKTQSPTYDHNGNMLTDGTNNYTWDAENQLISVTPTLPTWTIVAGGGPPIPIEQQPSQMVRYTYDWRGRRTSKLSYRYFNAAWVAVSSTSYKYSEWNPIEEKVTNTHTGAVTTKNYVWGNDLSGNMKGAGGVGGLLSQRLFVSGATTPAVYFYGYDGNGNVRALVQANAAAPASSGMVERYAYDGFGRELAGNTPAASSVNAFRFSTKQADPETGMNYYGYRYYAADAGRWINRDPIFEKGGKNIYAMTGNDVVDKWDVNGLSFLKSCHISGTPVKKRDWYFTSIKPNGTALMSAVEYNSITIVWAQDWSINCCCTYLGFFSGGGPKLITKSKTVTKDLNPPISFVNPTPLPPIPGETLGENIPGAMNTYFSPIVTAAPNALTQAEMNEMTGTVINSKPKTDDIPVDGDC